jgi:hypothetical protein
LARPVPGEVCGAGPTRAMLVRSVLRGTDNQAATVIRRTARLVRDRSCVGGQQYVQPMTAGGAGPLSSDDRRPVGRQPVPVTWAGPQRGPRPLRTAGSRPSPGRRGDTVRRQRHRRRLPALRARGARPRMTRHATVRTPSIRTPSPYARRDSAEIAESRLLDGDGRTINVAAHPDRRRIGGLGMDRNSFSSASHEDQLARRHSPSPPALVPGDQLCAAVLLSPGRKRKVRGSGDYPGCSCGVGAGNSRSMASAPERITGRSSCL